MYVARLLLRRSSSRRVAILLVLCAAVAGAVFAGYPRYEHWLVERRIDVCEKSGTTKQQCFDALILATAQQRDISEAFDVLSVIYGRDREFATFCHGSTHQLGELAFDLFERGSDIPMTSKTSYCGYGFFHGFLEKLVYTNGNLAEARRFCSYVDKKLSGSSFDASLACYHGIGHGVTDGSDPGVWGDADRFIAKPLALCEEVGDSQEQRSRCASGVFNALAVSYMDPKYHLGANPDDPYALCRRQREGYARQTCYDQMNGYVVLTQETFTGALRIAERTAEPAYRSIAVRSIAGYVPRAVLSSGQPMSGYLSACRSLGDPELRSDCAVGIAGGIIEFGTPGREYELGVDMCMAGQELQRSCMLGVISGVQSRLSSDSLRALCDYMHVSGADEASVQACRDALEGRLSA